jgi:hypothetical protein
MKLRHSTSAVLGFALLAAIAPLGVGCGHESAASPGGATPTAAIEAAPSPVATAPAPTESTATAPAAAEPIGTEPAANSAEPAASAAKPEDPANDAEPPRKIGQRPPADRTPTRPGEAEKITWDDLNIGMPADVVFRPFMLSDRVKELEGKKISILGFIHGAATGGSRAKIKNLILLKNTECKYGPQGQADHLAAVYFAEGKAAAYTDKAIKVEGTLKIEPFTGTDGNTWSVFRLEDAVVK